VRNYHISRRMSQRRAAAIFLALICVVCASAPVGSSGSSPERVLPSPACGEGWVMEEKAALYTKDTLFERINGESELYFPYGFEVLASARYVNEKAPRVAVEADVYRMGTLLDAFGMYANYRRTDDDVVAVGAEGFVSSSQLLFYQDRYFVRLQASGTSHLEREVFLACASAVSQKLPRNSDRPGELKAFAASAVIPRSERYVAQSLLGYAFFRRGLIADAVLGDARVQVFMVPEESPDAARKAFDQYRAYLGASGQNIRVTEADDLVALEAVDPLYGKVYVEQTRRYLVGAVRVPETSAAKRLVGQLRERLAPVTGGIPPG